MKGFIYMIKCNDANITDCYIGSTKNLVSRIKTHKSNCKNSNCKAYNYKVYEFIRNNGGFENFKFETIKEVEINNKNDLIIQEVEQYELFKPTLNSNTPKIQIDMKDYQKEYYKTKYTHYHKKRYQDKKEEYKERNKNKYKIIKELLKKK